MQATTTQRITKLVVGEWCVRVVTGCVRYTHACLWTSLEGIYTQEDLTDDDEDQIEPTEPHFFIVIPCGEINFSHYFQNPDRINPSGVNSRGLLGPQQATRRLGRQQHNFYTPLGPCTKHSSSHLQASHVHKAHRHEGDAQALIRDPPFSRGHRAAGRTGSDLSTLTSRKIPSSRSLTASCEIYVDCLLTM